MELWYHVIQKYHMFVGSMWKKKNFILFFQMQLRVDDKTLIFKVVHSFSLSNFEENSLKHSSKLDYLNIFLAVKVTHQWGNFGHATIFPILWAQNLRKGR